MEKLPPTSYVRLVDIWLICGQLIPFIEVILLTLKEVYNVEVDEVHHHGHARKVGLVPQVSSQVLANIMQLQGLQSWFHEIYCISVELNNGSHKNYKIFDIV